MLIFFKDYEHSGFSRRSLDLDKNGVQRPIRSKQLMLTGSKLLTRLPMSHLLGRLTADLCYRSVTAKVGQRRSSWASLNRFRLA